MDFMLHVDTRLALAILAAFAPLLIAKLRSLWHIHGMPTRRSRPKAKPDVNQLAAAAVSAITGTTAESGEELLGSEELRAALRKAKEEDAAKQPAKGRIARKQAA